MKEASFSHGVSILRCIANITTGLLAVLIPGPIWAAPPSCSQNIIGCGCVVTEPGRYMVSTSFSSSSSNEDCIQIAAPNVELDFSGSITGPPMPGSSATQKAGIRIKHTATRFVLKATDGATISQFNYGIAVQSNGAVLDGFQATGNGIGVYLGRASHNHLSHFDASGNQSDGVLLWNAHHNQILDFTASNNGRSGLELSSRSTLNKVGSFITDENQSAGVELSRVLCVGRFTGPACHQPGPAENVVIGGEADGNAFGISVIASYDNEIIANGAKSNQQFDLYDGGKRCEQNHWRGNTFTTANHECIQ
jgi:hypothetical protein